MNYQQRISNVLEYIDTHLDGSITLLELCSVAHFSQYHFHRLFSAWVGMPLAKYIQYIKLKRAAYQLDFQKQKKIIDIAFEAGFDSHEAFSRAFKKACGFSPSQFRQAAIWEPWQLKPYKNVRSYTMNVEVKEINAIRTASVKHRGDFHKINETVTKLINWSQEKHLPLKHGECFGIAYNDPETTASAEFEFDFCMQISAKQNLTNQIVHEHIIPAGRYAVARHVGSQDNIGDTVKALYRDWLPETGEELRDVPCFFQYHNFAHEVQESALIADVYLPLK